MTRSEAQSRSVGKRYKKRDLAVLWVVEQWHKRPSDRFQTRDAFVEWCLEECPHEIEADHDRVRDKWLPRGKANRAGESSS